MTQDEKQNNVQNNQENRVDEVGETNVYPVSEMKGADENAEVHAPGKIGEAENAEPNQNKAAGGNGQ